MFINRTEELHLLTREIEKSRSSLVVCKGRRRIGKSRLIQEISKKVNNFWEFQGLPPREGQSINDQLKSFSQQLAKYSKSPLVQLQNWQQAFSLMNRLIPDKGKTIIFLDEISWLGIGDKDFAGKIKIAWDTEFKKNSHLTVILCGSVSSWLEKNILNHTGFAGRIALELTLEEIPLSYCTHFWRKKRFRISSNEILKVLSVMGGIPRYLEEIEPSESAEENLKRICCTNEGFLFSEFNQIFSDIFDKKNSLYIEILKVLCEGRKTIQEITVVLDKKRGGHYSEYLSELVSSGFVARDYVFVPGSRSPSRFTLSISF